MTASADLEHAEDRVGAATASAEEAGKDPAPAAAGRGRAVPDRRFSIADDDNEDASSCFEEPSAGAAAAASILVSLAERSAVVRDTLACSGPTTLDRRFSIDGDDEEAGRVADTSAAMAAGAAVAGAARLATFAGSGPAPLPEPAPAAPSWRAKRYGLVLTTLAAAALVLLGAARVLVIAL
ncbi:uncharacterized protein LOC117645357 [Thrips palmi]|uniref:Uncharacterized protein LOC117645357 n=1 Tax=Thrips palmi TaxID=161013 RepID=A0A6P8YVY7_THRPL|nr:uncharacterized protein LOC117645357 [Thrips palmi]